ncbi:MAG: 50S ribosomal protein L3 [Clostridiales bacterium]|jgi:large subunit ribosomal protein L3|nr:50S ribosomal protein L3 [Clostridiales bacterium]
MKKAIIGRKLGMSQIFTEDGTVIPVTVVLAGPCTVLQVKTKEKDGYTSVKVGYEPILESRVNKPDLGQFRNAQSEPLRFIKEFKFENSENYKPGDKISCSIFSVGDRVDVTGRTKGRGYTGAIKRWGFARGPSAHGSGYHRGLGALSANSSPSRVFKNRKMPGQYGNEQVTIKNLEIVRIDESKNAIFIAGGIPGPKKSVVTIKSTKKVSNMGSKWFK